MAPESEFWRLRKDSLKEIKKEWRKRAGLKPFLDWAKKQDDPLNISKLRELHATQDSLDKVFNAMMRGEGVPKRMIAEYAFFLGEHLKDGRKYTFSKISEPCDPPATEGTPLIGKNFIAYIAGHDYLMTFYNKVKTIISELFTISDESYCRTEKDVEEAVRMVFVGYGIRNGKISKDDEEAAIRFCESENEMNRTIGKYIKFMIRMWRVNKSVVMFAALRTRLGEIERVGVSGVFPLKQGFYTRLREGEVESMDMTEDDIDENSGLIFIDFLCENMTLSRKEARGKHSMCHIHTLCYQIASLTPPADEIAKTYRIICFGGDEEATKRIKANGYRELGTFTPISKKPIFELRKPDGTDNIMSYISFKCHYDASLTILDILQRIIANQPY